jgi:hypothetical protein
MPLAPLTKCKIWWLVLLTSLEDEYETLIEVHPDAKMEIDQIGTILVQISQLLRNASEENVDGEKWQQLVYASRKEMKILYHYTDGQALFTALLRLFSTVYNEMGESLQANSVEAETEAALQPELQDLEHLLKYKKKLRKLWQQSRDPKVKTDLNRVTNAIKRMIRRNRILTIENEESELGGHTSNNMA